MGCRRLDAHWCRVALGFAVTAAVDLAIKSGQVYSLKIEDTQKIIQTFEQAS